MSAIFPQYISPDGMQFVFTLASEEAVTYICSSVKLRNAVRQVLNEKLRPAPDSALHYKEAAVMIIKAVKKNTGQDLKSIEFNNGQGKFLIISPTNFQHNFAPTKEDEVLDSPSAEPKLTRRQAEIRARLEQLAL